MTYRTILAVLDSPKTAGQITSFGATLAERHSAHLIGMHAETIAAMPLIAPMEIPDPGAVQVLQDIAHTETVETQRAFNEASRRDGLSAEWRSLVSSAGYSASSALETARSVDLIIASQSDPGRSDHRADLETFLFDSGRPMLLIPSTMTVAPPIRRVLVAWNGSREASRATFDALPFLKEAEGVEVFCVDPPERGGQVPDMAGAEITANLARHGVSARLVTQEARGTSAAKAIENRLAENSVDLLVMGGYGNSRWWEMLFGGVTRSLLDSMTALTLMSR